MESKKRVLVTGPDGFVGAALCRVLLERGYVVRGAQLEAVPLPDPCESVVVGDLGLRPVCTDALRDVDAVIHLAARVHVMQETSGDPLSEFRRTNVDGTQHLAEAAAKAGVSRFVYVSSIKVNGESTDGGAYSEEDPPEPEDPYGISKWEAEQALHDVARKSGLSVTVIRPPLIYGPGVRANFLRLVNWVSRGIPLPLGCVTNKRGLIALTNFTDALVTAMEHPAASGETFLVSDGHDVSTPELIQAIALALNHPARLFSVPLCILNAIAFVTGKQAVTERLTGSLELDISKIQKTLHWSPPCTMADELAQTATWFQNR